MDEYTMQGEYPQPKKEVVPAENFCATLQANVDNKKLSDKEFRAFVRHTLPIVQFKRTATPQQLETGARRRK